jgi:hypothetical protein
MNRGQLDPIGYIGPLGMKLTPRGEDRMFAPPVLVPRVCLPPWENECVNVNPWVPSSPPMGHMFHPGANLCYKTGLGPLSAIYTEVIFFSSGESISKFQKF